MVPTTRAPYEPLKKIATRISKKVSRDASAYLPLSNFHITNTRLKNTRIPTKINSIVNSFMDIIKSSKKRTLYIHF